jgi:hypothetical protein
MRSSGLASFALVALTAGCSAPASPARPSPAPAVPATPSLMAFEAESGSGDGDLKQRSRASGGLTIHLAPGQRRQWTFATGAQQAQYVVSVAYSNDNPGDTEVLRVELDGEPIGTIRAQDTGDDGAGWEIFVADRAGASTLHPGTHRLVVESSGGDGCIEIDRVLLKPEGT